MEYIFELIPQVLEGLKVTLEVFGLTLILSIPLGILIALMRTSKSLVLKNISGADVLVMRGTPLLLQIIFIYFGLSIIGIKFERFPAGILAFTLNYGAYFGEIFRGGIISIDKGQIEGAQVLGLSTKDIFFRITLPQAFKRVISPITNEITTLVKDTSLIYVLGLEEMLKIAKTAANRDVSLIPFLVVGIAYLIVIAVVSFILKKVEQRYDYYK